MHAVTTSKTELELGAKLGAIIQDSDAREKLIENPADVLGGLGANSEVVIHADTADKVHLVVPAEVDLSKVQSEDDAYFEELGLAALGSCFYEDLPE
ncbi:hypothetical protein [uncultured Roseibium sp.]|uniref:hypothetical protein n=1 Tax=uncultured Roseibium sp. TaxID=1936171 RepID=UPI00262699C6|nr:hypothetical protein [uncultured Roseibium sp.]